MGLMPRARRFAVVGHLQARALRVRLRVRVRLARHGASALLGQDAARPDRAARRRHLPARPPSPIASPRDLGTEYLTQDWADMNRSLFSALWLEKMAISITIGLIVMVAALNIIASLVLLVMEKSRDIAHPEDDGRVEPQHHDHLHAAGADHRPGRHGRRRGRSATALVVRARSLPADSGSRPTSTRCRTCRSACCRWDFAVVDRCRRS